MRTFVALPIPPGPATDHLVACRRRLQEARPDVKWVADNHYHVTLRFLGDIAPDQAPNIVEAMRRAASAAEPFPLTLGGVGAFPNTRRPRTLVVEAADAGGRLPALERALSAALRDAGIPPEDRPFRGHVTLGRVRAETGAAELRRRLEERGGATADFTARHITLFESRLTPAGPVYTIYHEAPLGANVG